MTLLLKSGADPNIRTRNGAIPLDLAHGNGRLGAVLSEWMGIVVSQGLTDVTRSNTAPQDPLPRVTQSSIDRGKGTNSSDKGTSLCTASKEGDIETVRSLLDSGTDVNERDDVHRTPVFYASWRGRVEVAKLLIEYGADVNSQDGAGWAPLHTASKNGYLNVVWLLLDHDADVNTGRHDQWTALHLASLHGHFEVVETLLKQGANVGVRNDEGRTPSQVASRWGKRDIVQLLSEYDIHGV